MPDDPIQLRELTKDEQQVLFTALWSKYKYHVTVIDREQRILHIYRMLGAKVTDGIGQPLEQFVVPEQREAMRTAIAQAFDQDESRWYEVAAPVHQERRQFRVTVIPTMLRGCQVALLISQDETERQRALDELARAQAQYATLTTHLPDFAVYVDRERRYLWVNRVAPGLEPKDVLGNKVDSFTHPDELETMRAAVERCFERREPTSYIGTTDLIGGKRHWLMNRIVPVPPENGVERVMILTADVTEQKEAELALRTSEARLDLALKASGTGLWEWWPKRDTVRLDVRWTKADGDDSTREYGTESWLALVAPEDQAALRSELRAVSQGLKPGFDLEYRMRTGPARAPRWVAHRARVVESSGSGPVCVVGTQHDVSERRRADDERRALEEQLQRAQRLESLGKLAGGIAHDFNNLLLVILGNAELLGDELEEHRIQGIDLGPIIGAAQRAAELTRQLLAFSRRQRLEQVPVDIAEVLEPQLRMLRRLIPESVSIVFDHPKSSAWAAVDPAQFEQVVMNLLLNARDAMPDGGRIDIQVVAKEVTEDDLTPEDLATHGSFAGLIVTDNGSGMTEDERVRAFEPFFTTKPVGQGTGLGLAMIDGIVKQHGDFIRCSSTKGKGTTFEIYWPAAPPGSKAPAALQQEVLKSGRGRLLLAEDEDLLRDVTRRVLLGAGYDVTVVADGAEALQAIEDASAPFDLLVLDAVMPGTGGYQVLLGARQRFPRVPVLFTTGYAGSALPPDVEGFPLVQVMKKPYRRAALLALIAELLERSRREQ